MERSRKIAAAPKRLAPDTWDVVAALIFATLSRSPFINSNDIDTALAASAPVGMMLIAAGHMDRRPLVVLADPVHLEISTVSGDEAFNLEENLAPVPGGASATEWTVHFSVPDHLLTAAANIIEGKAHLSLTEISLKKIASRSAGPNVDLDAVLRRSERA